MTTTLDILDRLVGFDTVSAKSNLALIDYAEAHLRSCGFTVQRLPDETGQKAGLYAEIGPAGDGVLLSAHTDVVPVEGQSWSRDPFRLARDEDRVFGRGTTDMKGFVASALALADRAAGVDLKEPLKLALSYDEEVGCVGLQEMLSGLAPMLGQPRACIVGEPTEMTVAVGHKGKAALRAVCIGEAGHSALAPNFTNALHLATELVRELRALQAHLKNNGARDEAYSVPYSTVHVGKLSGGTSLNIVPDRAELVFEYRHLAADPGSEILARIKAVASRIEAAHAPNGAITVEQYNAYPGLDVPASAAVTAEVQRLAHSNQTTKVAFGTEAGFFDELGIPTVVCGPGSMEQQGHKPDESISLQQLTACDEMMDRILDDLTL